MVVGWGVCEKYIEVVEFGVLNGENQPFPGEPQVIVGKMQKVESLKGPCLWQKE